MVGQPLSIGGCFFFLSPLLLSSLPSSVPPSPLSILPSFLSTLNFLHTVKIFSKLSTLNLHYFCNQNKHMWIKKLKMACSWKKKSSLQYSRIKSYIRKIGIRKQLCIICTLTNNTSWPLLLRSLGGKKKECSYFFAGAFPRWLCLI